MSPRPDPEHLISEALPDLLASLKVTAQAIWLINQEPFAPGDLEP